MLFIEMLALAEEEPPQLLTFPLRAAVGTEKEKEEPELKIIASRELTALPLKELQLFSCKEPSKEAAFCALSITSLEITVSVPEFGQETVLLIVLVIKFESPEVALELKKALDFFV